MITSLGPYFKEVFSVQQSYSLCVYDGTLWQNSQARAPVEALIIRSKCQCVLAQPLLLSSICFLIFLDVKPASLMIFMP